MLLEIVGFWTPDYLSRKLERVRAAGLTNLVLCIDESLNCADATLADALPVLRYKRSIDPKTVLETVQAMLDAGSRRSPTSSART